MKKDLFREYKYHLVGFATFWIWFDGVIIGGETQQPISNPLLLCVTTLFAALALLLWGTFITSLRFKVLLQLFFISVIVSSVVNLTTIILSPLVSSSIFLLSSLITIFCLFKIILGARSAKQEKDAVTAPTFFEKPRGDWWPQAALLIAIGAVSLIISFTHQMSINSSTEEFSHVIPAVYLGRLVISIICLCALTKLLELLSKRHTFIVLLIAIDIAFLLFPLSMFLPFLAPIALFVSGIVYLLLDVAVWGVIAKTRARSTKLIDKTVTLWLGVLYGTNLLGNICAQLLGEGTWESFSFMLTYQILSAIFVLASLVVIFYSNQLAYKTSTPTLTSEDAAIEKVQETNHDEIFKQDNKTIEEKLSPFGLTPREVEVVILLAQRKSCKEISETLFVSENTIKTHTSRIYQKTNLHTRKEISDFFDRE